MRKILSFCFAFVLAMAFSANVSAQNFEKGAAVFSGGYGFLNLGKAFFTGTVDAAVDSAGMDIKSRAFGPLYLKAEYGLGDNFGIGFNFAYVGMNAEWNSETNFYKMAFNNTSLMLRLNSYLVRSNNIDLYTGFGIGYRGIGGWKVESDDPFFEDINTTPIPLAFELTGGLRIYVTDNFAIYGEAGASKGLIQVGATYKL